MAVNHPPRAWRFESFLGDEYGEEPYISKVKQVFHIRSSLGNYLRSDREDFVRDRQGAAEFSNEEAAYTFIEETWGRNGTFYFFPVWKKERDMESEPTEG